MSQVDERGRAAREHAALSALSEAGLERAPAAYGIVRSDGLDVLFSEWREGEPLDDAPPPESPAWRDVVDAYAEVHGRCDPGSLRPTVLGVDLAQVVEDMRARLRLFDDGEGTRVVEAAERRIPDRLPPRRRALVHCEASLANFVRAADGSLTIVDWENSGLGDACFDPANIVLAPQHAHRELAAWDELFVRHARLLGDEGLARRTRAHAEVLAAWWVVRLRQERAAPTPRLAGVASAVRDSLEQRLSACEERAAAVLGL